MAWPWLAEFTWLGAHCGRRLDAIHVNGPRIGPAEGQSEVSTGDATCGNMPAMIGRLLFTWLISAVLTALVVPTARGQGAMDDEARALFNAGRVAFDDARYADALGHFRRAHELSGRTELLYNIGLAADRLRRDEEALEAFEAYLRELPDSPRSDDIRARVEILRETLARHASETPEPTATVEPPSDDGSSGDGTSADTTSMGTGQSADGTPPVDDGPPIAGPAVLGAVGLVGIGAAVVGLVAANDCLTMDAGRCSEQRSPSGLAIGVYGGLGIAAVAAALVWLLLGDGDPEAAEGGGPTVALSSDGLGLAVEL